MKTTITRRKKNGKNYTFRTMVRWDWMGRRRRSSKKPTSYADSGLHTEKPKQRQAIAAVPDIIRGLAAIYPAIGMVSEEEDKADTGFGMRR